ncbi:hypothetical protein LBMAG47_23550 [Planctomycetia bacterium]|nr:hypothetical protein LBMAG47_23550 [Planctomycetia bacterium]
MRILLANETGAVPHLGCRAVADAHARLLGRAGHRVVDRLFLNALRGHEEGSDKDVVAAIERDGPLMARLADVDAVVVNGEGTIHHGAGRSWLGLLQVAQGLGKITLLVNAVLEETNGFESMWPRLTDCTVREPRSWDAARRLGARPRVVADSYLAAGFASTGTPLAGDIVTDWHGQCAASGAILEWYLRHEGGTFLPLRTPQAADEWAGLPHRLGAARVVITGRHHGVYAAIVAGRPFVALASNTYKIEATLEAVGLARLVVATPQEAVAQRDWALENPGVFRALAARLAGGRPLPTFAALGSGGPDREEEEVAALAADVARHIVAG